MTSLPAAGRFIVPKNKECNDYVLCDPVSNELIIVLLQALWWTLSDLNR